MKGDACTPQLGAFPLSHSQPLGECRTSVTIWGCSQSPALFPSHSYQHICSISAYVFRLSPFSHISNLNCVRIHGPSHACYMSSLWHMSSPDNPYTGSCDFVSTDLDIPRLDASSSHQCYRNARRHKCGRHGGRSRRPCGSGCCSSCGSVPTMAYGGVEACNSPYPVARKARRAAVRDQGTEMSGAAGPNGVRGC